MSERAWRLATLGAVLVGGLLVAGPALAAAASPAPALIASPAPCGPTAGACSSSPSSLGVTFPAGVPSGADAVEVAWITTGRPAGAPTPADPVVILTTATGNCPAPTGQAVTCTWPWPAGLEAAGATGVLNGTYHVAPCTTVGAPSGGCTLLSSPAPTSFGIAAPAAAPSGMTAQAPSSAAGTQVTVRWKLGAAPDLAGYQVHRNGQVLGACTLHGAVTPGAAACGASPSFTDASPGSGQLAYQVTALRYGTTGGFANAVASAPTGATLTLQAPGSTNPLSPVPQLATPATPTVTVPVATPTPASGARSPATSPGTADTYGQLPVSSGPPRTPLAGGTLETGPASTHGVGSIALVAAGLLVLAVVGHLLFLRGAVARFQAGHGSGGSARSRRWRVQWGGWPPVRPSEGAARRR